MSTVLGNTHGAAGFAGILRVSTRVLPVLLILVVTAVGWFTMAPRAIGGPASYVVTEGASMLPSFEAGGLVITRTQTSYEVGDVAAYHNKDMNAVVMHRIVELDGSRYVLQGDNNDFLDQYRPTADEMVGKKWVYWPGAGRVVNVLRDPITFAMILGGITVLSLRVPGRNRRRRRHHAW